MNIISKFESASIHFYQKTLSFEHGFMGKIFPWMQICMFEPTCSEYMDQALQKHGLIKGNWIGFKRICRCGPWSYGKDKFDPVP